MLQFLKRLLGNAPASESHSHQINGTPGGNAAANFATWLAADAPNNPFGMAGFDCSDFVGSMLSTTTNPSIAFSFTRFRSSDGREYIDQLPADAAAVECNLRYEGEAREGPLFKASEMEDKWDIYLWKDRLSFCRSWTGELCFVAELFISAGQVIVRRVWYSLPQTTASLAVEQMNFLIMSHLYGSPSPHPLPSDLPPEPQAVALFSFSQYGRRCWFGTYENTLGTHAFGVKGGA